MNIRLERIHQSDGEVQFAATNGAEHTVTISSSNERWDGARPMELVAMGLASCSSIDVLSILQKQRQQVDRYEVSVEAERDYDNVPAVFKHIHLHFSVEGKVDPPKVQRAIELSLTKYCSVSKMLEKTASITYAYTVNGEEFSSRA